MLDSGSPEVADSVRAAEIAAALSLATDLGMGLPWEHGLAATMSAMRLCDLVGVDEPTRRQAYYATQLVYVGCGADAVDLADVFTEPISRNVGVIWGSHLEQLRVVLRAIPDPHATPAAAVAQIARGLPQVLRRLPGAQLGLCEVAQQVSGLLGLPAELGEAFFYLTDRWDGSGVLRRGRGEEIPLGLRIALLARDAAYWAAVGGPEVSARVIGRRAGKAHDPSLVTLLVKNGHTVLDVGSRERAGVTLWDALLAAEPDPWLTLQGDRVDRALSALGDFADLLSPSMGGHARAVADLAGGAASLFGLPEPEARHVKRVAMVQDIGRIRVDPRVWETPGGLTAGEWEEVRLHPYFTERICASSPFLRRLGVDAACHHERLDGSGYHRGVGAELLPLSAQIPAAADMLQSLLQHRPYRAALSLPAAIDLLAEEVQDGRMSADVVAAVVEAAGGEVPPLSRPAGLTEREAQIVGLLARGLATKQVARTLGISPKTVDRHTEHAYRKIGVSSRAGVTLFAAEHGLLAWGEHPMGRPS